MPIKTDIKTSGFDTYLEQIVSAGRDVDSAVFEAASAGADILLEGMQRRVAKDTRNLESHLQIENFDIEGNVITIRIGIPHNIKLVDEDTARYAVSQEYGWNTKNGWNSGQSYIRATMDKDKTKAGRAIKAVFDDWLKSL